MSASARAGRGAGDSRRANAPPEIAVASLYKTDLITRHTGRVVRLSIEGMLAEQEGPSITILDFGDVSLIDFSCADEVVAKLMARTVSTDVGYERFFLFRGIADDHLDPVESALRRRGLAVAAESRHGEPRLIGATDPDAQTVWEELCRAGKARASAVAERIGMDAQTCTRLLETMVGRRLVCRDGDSYMSLFRAFTEAESSPSSRSSGPGRGDNGGT